MEDIARILDSCQPYALTYPNVGATLAEKDIQLPDPAIAFDIDTSVHLGNGDQLLSASLRAICANGKIFNLPWLTFYHQTAAVEKDTAVGILIRNFRDMVVSIPAKSSTLLNTTPGARQFGFVLWHPSATCSQR